MDEMTGVLEAFPALKNKYKLQRIYDLAQDLPLDVFGYIVVKIADDAKSSPSINDFKDQISRWRREYYAKYGRYYGQPEQEVKTGFDCEQCIDSGIIELFVDGKFSHHIRCNCEQGQKHWAKIPQWDKDLRQAFFPKAPTLSNFKPSSKEFGEFLMLAENWAKKIRTSENYWKQLGYDV